MTKRTAYRVKSNDCDGRTTNRQFLVLNTRHQEHIYIQEIIHFIVASVRVWTGSNPLFLPNSKKDGRDQRVMERGIFDGEMK